MAATNTNSLGMSRPVTSVSTTDLTSGPIRPGDPLYPGDGIPNPPGTDHDETQRAQSGRDTDPMSGMGTEGEVDVWQARYSNRNFIGRIALRIVLTVGWLALAVYTWSFGHSEMSKLAWVALAIIGVIWIALLYRMIQAHYSHYYRLTNRRLFVSTGVINRRRDMMELLRVKDVFTRQQSLLERWLGLGSVVVVPSEKELPTFYLTGVNDPKEVMDLIWHHARAERDQRSLKVENV